MIQKNESLGSIDLTRPLVFWCGRELQPPHCQPNRFAMEL